MWFSGCSIKRKEKFSQNCIDGEKEINLNDMFYCFNEQKGSFNFDEDGIYQVNEIVMIAANRGGLAMIQMVQIV